MLNFILYTFVGVIGIAFGFCLRIAYSMAGALIACALLLGFAITLRLIGYAGPMALHALLRLKTYVFRS